MNWDEYGMSCEDFTKFIMDHLDGALAPERAAAFQKHLTKCPNCECFLNSYRNSISATALLSDDACADVPEELVHAVLESIKKK